MFYRISAVYVLLLVQYGMSEDKRLVLDQQNNTDVAQEVAALTQDLKFLRQEVSVLTTALQYKGSEIAALQQDNQQKNATLASLERELNMMRQEVQMLSSNMSSKNSDIFKLGQDFLKSNFTLSNQDLAITTLQQRMQVVISDLTTDADEITALQQETGQLKSSLSALQSNLTATKQVTQTIQSEMTSKFTNMTLAQHILENNIAAVKRVVSLENDTLAKLGQDVQGLNSHLTNHSQKLASIDRELDQKANTEDLGSTYIRWGRTTCDGAGNSTQLVYKGYIGGAHYNQRGSGANMLCLPEHPNWAQYHGGNGAIGGRLYGVEYYNGYSSIFNPFGFTDYERAACVVCRTRFSATTMVPGTTSCASGWTSQYTGYLMSGHFDQNAMSDYICVDSHPEKTTVPDNGGEHGNLLYFVQAKCGTLPCKTYPDGRQLACTVCSK